MLINDFEEIKSRVPILEFLERENIILSKNHTSKCPLKAHENEKTASFKVYPSSNSFYCFGCGKGGDTITLAKLLHGFNTNLEAGKYINQKFGLGLFEERLSSQQWKEIQKQAKKRKIIKLTIGSYQIWKVETEKWFICVFRNLWKVFINCSPKNFEEPHKDWHMATNYVYHIEKILYVFLTEPREVILKNFDIINSWQAKIQKEIDSL